MLANAVEFEAKIEDDWKISIPQEYRGYLSALPRVILLNTAANHFSRNDSDVDMQSRMDSLNRLNGLLKGRDVNLDSIRSERLSRQ